MWFGSLLKVVNKRNLLYLLDYIASLLVFHFSHPCGGILTLQGSYQLFLLYTVYEKHHDTTSAPTVRILQDLQNKDETEIEKRLLSNR